MSEALTPPLIRNCRFAFRRHQLWHSLEHTPDPRGSAAAGSITRKGAG